MCRDSPLEWLPGLATPSPSSVMYPGGGVSVIGKLALSGHVSPRPAAESEFLTYHQGIDSKESIQPAYAAWRACTISLILLGS
jgi:hypothetical protein